MPTIRSSAEGRDLANRRHAADAAREGDARQRRLAALAKKAEIEAARLEGALLPRDGVLRLVHRLAREEREAILAWPASVAPVIAAAIGADPARLQAVLDRSLREHLASRAAGGGLQPALDALGPPAMKPRKPATKK
jgi:hypothetical protein